MSATLYRANASNDACVVGPGEALKQVRESKQIHLSEMARQLDLTTTQINALERDDYSFSPTPIITRAYLKSYARLLNLPDEDILDRFQRYEAGLRNTETSSDNYTHLHSTSSHAQWISYLVGLAFLILAVIWWQAKNPVLHAVIDKPKRFAAQIKNIKTTVVQAVNPRQPKHLAVDDSTKAV